MRTSKPKWPFKSKKMSRYLKAQTDPHRSPPQKSIQVQVVLKSANRVGSEKLEESWNKNRTISRTESCQVVSWSRQDEEHQRNLDTDHLPKAAMAAGCRREEDWPEPDGDTQIKMCLSEEPNAGDRQNEGHFLQHLC